MRGRQLAVLTGVAGGMAVGAASSVIARIAVRGRRRSSTGLLTAVSILCPPQLAFAALVTESLAAVDTVLSTAAATLVGLAVVLARLR